MIWNIPWLFDSLVFYATLAKFQPCIWDSDSFVIKKFVKSVIWQIKVIQKNINKFSFMLKSSMEWKPGFFLIQSKLRTLNTDLHLLLYTKKSTLTVTDSS